MPGMGGFAPYTMVGVLVLVFGGEALFFLGRRTHRRIKVNRLRLGGWLFFPFLLPCCLFVLPLRIIPYTGRYGVQHGGTQFIALYPLSRQSTFTE